MFASTAQPRQWYPNKEHPRSPGLILVEVIKERAKHLGVKLHCTGPTPPHDASARIVDFNGIVEVPSYSIIAIPSSRDTANS